MLSDHAALFVWPNDRIRLVAEVTFSSINIEVCPPIVLYPASGLPAEAVSGGPWRCCLLACAGRGWRWIGVARAIYGRWGKRIATTLSGHDHRLTARSLITSLQRIPPLAVSRPSIHDVPTPWAFYFLESRMATAILVDGGFFIKRFRSLQPDNAFDPQRAAECIHRWASAANKSVPFSVRAQVSDSTGKEWLSKKIKAAPSWAKAPNITVEREASPQSGSRPSP